MVPQQTQHVQHTAHLLLQDTNHNTPTNPAELQQLQRAQHQPVSQPNPLVHNSGTRVPHHLWLMGPGGEWHMNTATVGEAGRNLGESQSGKTGSPAPNPSTDNRESPTTAGLDGFQAGDSACCQIQAPTPAPPHVPAQR